MNYIDCFRNFTLTFNNQEDFDRVIAMRDSFNIVDISWSDRIINFEDDEERQSFLDLAILNHCVKIENVLIGEL